MGCEIPLLFFEYGDVPVQGILVLTEVLFNPNSPRFGFCWTLQRKHKNSIAHLLITNVDNGQTESIGSHLCLLPADM